MSILNFSYEAFAQVQTIKPDVIKYSPFDWISVPPGDCPFEQSKVFGGIRFLGIKSGFHYGDTWYPSWAANDTLYSPWTDGVTKRIDGMADKSNSGDGPRNNLTGAGVIVGGDPLSMKVFSIGTFNSPSCPYMGRYPCGSLVYNGVWYYGTYALGPSPKAQWGELEINWPWMGPFIGFRYSTDYGKSWVETPHTPSRPLFGETGINGYPVKIGAPHFVDFGKNMQYSPDGMAYLIAHGADTSDKSWRFWNDSWITGDKIYLLRVLPDMKNMNDSSQYEFYAGKDNNGDAKWVKDFRKIEPLLEWDNNMGCVTVTYNAPLKRYLMCITDGGNTISKMNTYILESQSLTGKWRLVTYMKDFGEQAYFVNIPSRFISDDGKTMWLTYSGNYSTKDKSIIAVNPPGSHYGLVMQKIELISQLEKTDNKQQKTHNYGRQNNL